MFYPRQRINTSLQKGATVISDIQPQTEQVAYDTPDPLAERVAQLQQLFPEAFSEGRLDVALLTKMLGQDDGGSERFIFSWAGRRDAVAALRAPAEGTLVPASDESVNFEGSANVIIEGDNLEALKLLYKSYFGRVKMIYIDPPYNTGGEFIYPDNFAQPLDNYLRLTGQKTSSGEALSTNRETGGRIHSNWLTMMYPRLFLARQLLRDNGVIFISIDDHELAGLRMMMNEIFGEENFITTIVWQKKYSPQNDATYFSYMHDYIVVYAKMAKANKNDDTGWSLNLFPRSEEQNARYGNPDNDPRGVWKSDNFSVKTYSAKYDYPITNPAGRVIYPPKGRAWLVGPERFQELLIENRIWFGEDGNNVPSLKRFLSDVQQGTVPTTWWTRDNYGDNQEAKQEMKALLEGMADVFDTPKPVRLITKMLQLSTGVDGGDIAMDFFAGSGTTAQAVLELNREDGGNRRFILVQLPTEPTEKKGKYTNIAEITKERVRRVIQRLQQPDAGSGRKGNGKNGKSNGAVEQMALTAVQEEAAATSAGRNQPEDLGFRVFKLQPSNYQPATAPKAGDADAYLQLMAAYIERLRQGWQQRHDAVIWEVAIKEGYGLNAQIAVLPDVTINRVYRVSDPDRQQDFLITLDDTLNPNLLGQLELTRDTLFVCRAAALDSSTAANLSLRCRVKTI